MEEALGVIATRKPNAVTFNEACSADIDRIADETGYHARFAAVLHEGRPLRCVNPRRRGMYGNAVLTRSAIASSTDRAFTSQAGREERRWICVAAVQIGVCTTHLSTRGSRSARVANKGQREEFAAVLAARNRDGPVVAAGDMNRQASCAPGGMWARTDAQAAQLPGRQHGYGSRQKLAIRQFQTLRARYTDDFVLVTAERGAARARRAMGAHARRACFDRSALRPGRYRVQTYQRGCDFSEGSGCETTTDPRLGTRHDAGGSAPIPKRPSRSGCGCRSLAWSASCVATIARRNEGATGLNP